MQHYKIIISVVFILLLCGCNSNEDITSYKIKKPTVEYLEKIVDKQSTKLQLKWTAPSAWKELNPGTMRIANFNAIDSKNKSVNISISMFPGDVGGIESNVNRWRGQIDLAPQPIEKISQYTQNINLPLLGDAQIVNLENPQNNQSIKTVIVPNQNSQTIFIKIMGESDSLSELEYEFNLFVQSIYILGALN